MREVFTVEDTGTEERHPPPATGHTAGDGGAQGLDSYGFLPLRQSNDWSPLWGVYSSAGHHPAASWCWPRGRTPGRSGGVVRRFREVVGLALPTVNRKPLNSALCCTFAFLFLRGGQRMSTCPQACIQGDRGPGTLLFCLTSRFPLPGDRSASLNDSTISYLWGDVHPHIPEAHLP